MGTVETEENRMHSVAVTVRIDPDSYENAKKELGERVIPLIKSAPGFVHGYWLEPKPSEAMLQGDSLLLFENEAAAKAGAEMARSNPTPAGVRIARIEVRAVTFEA